MVKYEIKDFTMSCGDLVDLACKAPCTVYSVLYDNGLIDDPVAGMTAAEIAAYSEKPCCFTAEFDVPALAISMKNVYIRFHGLDTLCRIEINGTQIAKVNNMHRTYTYDIKTKVDIGKNTLKLYFDPPKADERNLRKSYSSFGSEISPKLPDMGIFRKIELIAFNNKIISDIKVKQTHSDTSVRLDLSLDTIGQDEFARAVATLTAPGGNVYFCGFIGGEGTITIGDPNLWWPNGLGVQSIYRLNVNLYSGEEIEDAYEMNIGLRTVAVTRDEKTGKATLLINKVPMFLMGADYMPEDILTSRLSEKRTRALLESAKEANFNTIFVHGSGYYPENYFFDACDELGLLVWQRVLVDDCEGDITPELRENIKAELKDNIQRMTNHPSLGVVLGNSRVSAMFDESEKPGLSYYFSAFEGMNVFDFEGSLAGDIITLNNPSIPTYDGVCTFTSPDKRNIGSDVFELHGASREAVITMLDRAYEYYPYANGMKELTYVIGMSAAEYARDAVVKTRCEDEKPMGISMGAMNSPWPTVSPAGIDYYGNRKPLHYYEHRFFTPVIVTAEQKGTRVRFRVANDMKGDYHGVFAYAIMDNKNRPVFRDSFPIRARASSKMEVHNVDLGSIIPGHEKEYYLLYSVSDNSTKASQGIHLFTKNKRFNFLKPTFTYEIEGSGTDHTVAVASDCFAKGVEISFDGVKTQMANNYFDIAGKAPVKIRFTTERAETVEKLSRVIRIRSIYDLGGEE